MIHNHYLAKAREEALLSQDIPLDEPMYSLTPPPIENKPNESK